MGLLERCVSPLWHDQFFTLAMVDFGKFLEALPATIDKQNLKNTWVKVRCRDSCSFLTELGMQIPQGEFTIRMEIFSPVNVPLRSISGFQVAADASSSGSRSGPDLGLAASASNDGIDEVVVGHLQQLQHVDRGK